MNKTQAGDALFQEGLHPLWKKAFRAELSRLCQDYARWLKQQEVSTLETEVDKCRFLIETLELSMESLKQGQNDFQQFLKRVQAAVNDAEKQQHILTYASVLGADRRQLQSDKKAFSRWLDTGAMRDRYTRKASEEEKFIGFLLQRLTYYFCQTLSVRDIHSLFQDLQSKDLLESLLLNRQNEQIVRLALSLLRQVLEHLGSDAPKIGNQLVHLCYRLSGDPKRDVWVRSEAVFVNMLIDGESVLKIIENGFVQPQGNDEMFWRARMVAVLVKLQSEPAAQELIALLLTDSSEHVRQGLCRHLHLLAPARCQHLSIALLDKEMSLPVLGVFIGQLSEILGQCSEPKPVWLRVLERAKAVGAPLLIQRLLTVGAKVLERWPWAEEPLQNRALEWAHDDNPHIQRWSHELCEWLWARSISAPISEADLARLNALPWQSKIRLLHQPQVSAEVLARFLAAHAKTSFGFDIEFGQKRSRITAGCRYGFRFWRFFFELRRSATDKRQNHSHTTGRIYYGLHQVPAPDLAELSQTTVPGEPLHIGVEGDWRPFLPLVDQMISALDQGWPTRALHLYTAWGVTSILPPGNLLSRLRARSLLTWRFERFASLRNWQSNSSFPAHEYIQQLRRLGFSIQFNAYRKDKEKKQKSRPQPFFNAASFMPLPLFWERFSDYFHSIYQNNLTQLLGFVAAISTIFFGRHFALGNQMKLARRSLPLVIGGWGTRGKSGTERLKAAVFNALGMSVLSKTTGCEAMFLFGLPNNPLREVFLFRPYDKASIWEQVNLVRLAKKLKADVFLWECMGLTPRYVKILQEQWMRDDLSTITNCYPDHEDIQGPRGIDIPQVMQNFVPKSSSLFTTENNMFPFLAEAAHKKNTDIKKVEEWEGAILPQDCLARFPYEEHPSNIALVLALAKELDIPQDFALKEMADRVVEDLGVLKVYPAAPVEGRKLEFINGMSANERHGALGNWNRLAMDQYSRKTPEHWVAVVINNRADRVPRSQVFARLLVNDIKVDKVYLIGNNLDGFSNYVEEAWKTRVAAAKLGESEAETCRQWLVDMVNFLGKASCQDDVLSRARAMGLMEKETESSFIEMLRTKNIESLDKDTKKANIKFAMEDQKDYDTFLELCALCETPNFSEESVQKISHQVSKWFMEKINVIWDYHASGDSIIRRIIDTSPQGLCTHIMGLQNIKGTGLDFVYRWQAWSQHYQDGELLKHGDEFSLLAAARRLAGVEDFGWLSFEFIEEAIAICRQREESQNEAAQAELGIILDRLVRQRKALQDKNSDRQSKGTLLDSFLNAVEAFFDAGEAVRRRKQADRIYLDLSRQQISFDRAISELKKINKAQKGGWLLRSLKDRGYIKVSKK